MVYKVLEITSPPGMNGQYLKLPKLCPHMFDTGIYVIGRYKLRTKTFNYQIPNTIDHHQDSSMHYNATRRIYRPKQLQVVS
jgi:hypothetical protein